jgi:hypothetical protein
MHARLQLALAMQGADAQEIRTPLVSGRISWRNHPERYGVASVFPIAAINLADAYLPDGAATPDAQWAASASTLSHDHFRCAWTRARTVSGRR